MPENREVLSDLSVCRAPDCTCARHPDPTCREILRIREDIERLRKAVGRFLGTLGPLYRAAEQGDAASERNAHQVALAELTRVFGERGAS